MIDHRRHAPIARCRSVSIGHEPSKAAPLYRGAKVRGERDMYATDHAEPQREGRFRWLMSTCLAAGVGGVSILVVIFGSAEKVARIARYHSEPSGSPELSPLFGRRGLLRA